MQRSIIYKMTCVSFPTSFFYCKDGRQKPDSYIFVLYGRSNVGKSSLINSLTGSKKLARVSKTPGRTTRPLFFYSSCCSFAFVDLPGYGYCRSKSQNRIHMSSFLNLYLQSSFHRRVVLFVCDARRFSTLDQDFLNEINRINIPFFVVLNKIDQVNNVQDIQKQMYGCVPHLDSVRIFLHSSLKKYGVDDIRLHIVSYL